MTAATPTPPPPGYGWACEQQPQTNKGVYDFQKWLKTYQFWVQTDANGNFTIPNVIAGENYTLWAYGPGAAGTFLSQNLSGRQSAAGVSTCRRKPFTVTVKAGDDATWHR